MLSPDQVKEILKKPKNKATIAEAIRDENRLRLHCEPASHRLDCSPALMDWELWVKAAFPAAFDLVQPFERFPLQTVAETETAFEALEKVFDGQNPAYNVEFTIPEKAEDWKGYRAKKKFADKWRTEGMRRVKTSINSMIIVDLPKDQNTSMPEPYFYWLDIRHAVDFWTINGDFQYLIFRANDEYIIVMDEDSYQLYRFLKGDDPDKAILVESTPHDITYCPVHWFWSTNKSVDNYDLKLSPITNQLGNLDYLLYQLCAKDYVDGYVSAPITASFQAPPCGMSYEAGDHIIQCQNGYLVDITTGHAIMMQGDGTIVKQRPCPTCQARKFNGPGTHIQVPMPTKEGQSTTPNILEAAKIITYPYADLQYLPEQLAERKRNFYQQVTGYGGEPNNDQAQNEKQIIAAFESRTLILRNLKKNFEIIMQWVDQTVCKLRYGKTFLSVSIDLGTDFYLYDAAMLDKMYQDAKSAKESAITLDFLDDQRWKTRFRNNPQQLARITIENHLDPMRHTDNRLDIDSAYQSGVLDWEAYNIKLNFSTFVKRFNREQAPLTEFGVNLPFDTRIEKIYEILRSYVKPEPKQINDGQTQQGQFAFAGR